MFVGNTHLIDPSASALTPEVIHGSLLSITAKDHAPITARSVVTLDLSAMCYTLS